ncbi:trypsin-like peptidase domain-containing protein [Candidatus Parcubacteria bacterium]|nr:trypsin-like peptidase domain-containing protein [Candidatus Parcubacteria bacterium]
MMKFAFALIFSLALFPSAAHAAWWNPLTWKAAPVGAPTSAISSSLQTGATGTSASFSPSVDELYKRIAELESKLQEAQIKIRQLGQAGAKTDAKEIAKTTDAPAPSANAAGLPEKDVAAKAKPAIVLVETATTTGAGVIIDSQGHILVAAHTVWIEGPDKIVIGAADEVSVTLASGAKKTAKLVGLDEATDAAILQISEKGTFSYIKPAHDSGIQKGDKAYVFAPSGYVAGAVSRKASDAVEVVSDIKPSDGGGALVNAQGGLIGIAGKPVCKVLEEMKTCLKYASTANNIRAKLPKLLEGMRLYKNKKGSTAEEIAVRGQFEQMYGRTKESGVIEFAIANATGENTYDRFNGKLGQDIDGKITKLYLAKLKSNAEMIYTAVDFLKSGAYNLNIFFINESGTTIANLGDYQRKVATRVAAENALKVKEYQDKVSLWSRKKNEYDSYIANPAGATHDYLLEQGLFVESAADYLSKEKKKVLDAFSGETVDIF